MEQTEKAVVKQRKPSKWVAVISAAVLLILVIASIVLGIVMPKSSVVDSPSGDYNSVDTVGNDLYTATTDGKITRMDSDGNVLRTLDLAAVAKERYGIEVGEATSVQTQSDTDNVWAFTSGNYLFRLQDKNNKIEMLDYVKLKDGMLGMTEKGNYAYVLEKDGRFGCFRKYDLTAPTLAEGIVSSGHLYTPSQEGSTGKITLKPANNLGILSFEIMERGGVEYAYIVHSDGLLRIATECSQNNWKNLYDARYPAAFETAKTEKYEAAYNEAYAAEVDRLTKAGKTVDEDKVKEVADSTALLTVKKAANEAVVKELGLISYDDSTGYVEIDNAKFNKNLYNNYFAKSVSYRGCGYNKAEDKYYIVTAGLNMIVCDAAQSFDAANKRPAGIAPFKHEDLGITLPNRPATEGSAMHYDKDLNVGYVLYSELRSVSRIDFNMMKITFTADLEFDIKSIVQSADGEMIYYTYLNPYEADAGQIILRATSIEGRENQNALEAVMTIVIVLAVCAAIVALFAVLCLFKRGFSSKFMNVMFGFKKQWIIYLIILGTMSLVAMFCFYPAIGSISLSFFDYTDQKKVRLWNNFAHYKYIFTTDGALKEFLNMFIFLVGDLFTSLVPPLIFAFFLTIMRNKSYSALMRTLLFIPGIIPGVATTLLWREGIYGEFGGINNFIGFFTGENPKIEFLTDFSTVKWSLIMMGFPFIGSYLIFYGAMMNVPDSYYEAAELDGITVIKRFVFIDIPLIFAQIKYVLIMTFIASVQNFGRTYMTETDTWGAKTPVHTMYNYVTSGNYGRASAYATILFIFLFIATMLNMRIQTKDNQVA